jgi:UMF1 family MFS transporter
VGWLTRIGLGRPELRAWALYDCANSAFFATVIQIFPIYFVRVAARDLPAARASSIFAQATFVAMAVVALMAPVLGVIADDRAAKKRFLAIAVLIGTPATAAFYWVRAGDWALGAVLFVIANIGVASSLVFYDSLLPHVARGDELDRVSTTGFGIGYLGSGLLMALNLAWIRWPRAFGIADEGSAMRLAFLSAGVWWLLFSIPILRRVHEPPAVHVGAPGPIVVVALRRLGRTLGHLRRYRQAFLFLVAFFIFNDGINTIIRMAALYGTELGIGTGAIIGSILAVQFVGVPFAVVFGRLADRVGARNALYVGLGVYLFITLFAYTIHGATGFLVLALLVGSVQGGTQALSRSLFASLIPRQRSGEFFGFFGITEKFSAVLGPALFSIVIGATGSARQAILAVAAFFVIGGVLLTGVDVPVGRAAARAAEHAIAAEDSDSV